MGLFLSEWGYLLRSKTNVNFTKTCFFKKKKQGYMHMPKHA